ncbi:related to phenol 2-monooxygenase [Rhynchosporium graminicola]|uniref:Related to phenol 2-monooxygenase n=1 Tax=Rhynchosporium graminicola TaxID=2792576 RepID=A0A1E1L2T7_9HELO|nr:related to phenol 2-monooxygenase [Rhynchosporium commune]
MATPEFVDIVIVGAGPVSLALSLYLTRWGYKVKHIDNRPEPTVTGRADGIQPRSLDILENLGLLPAIMAYKPAKVYEVAFWDPKAGTSDIERKGTWASCPSFVGAKHPFTTLLHQGMIEQVFISEIERWGGQLSHVTEDKHQTLRARYLFSGQGARSSIRQDLGVPMLYKDPIAHVWAVMDGVVKTTFPDIKMKCTIHSEYGSIMIIPREDNLVRLYVKVASSTDADWDPKKQVTEEAMQALTKKILQPYEIEWERVEWFSVYPIGQGIAERYTLDQRVFLGGDACHTHSPKAGQGMNTAFLDAQNLAWKIHLVESGYLKRDILLTYESERKAVAESLLDFDARYAKLFSEKQPPSNIAAEAADSQDAAPENLFVKTFKESCEFTSGFGVTYAPNSLNYGPAHPAQATAIVKQSALKIGRAFPKSTVTRVLDANVVGLNLEIPPNGSFRIYVFAGELPANSRALQDFETTMMLPNSFYTSFPRSDLSSVSHHEQDNPHSMLYTICTIVANRRAKVEISTDLPAELARYRDHVYADDVWDAQFPDSKAAAHAKAGLDIKTGGVVLVRPDGFVALVASLANGADAADALNQYFNSISTKSLGRVSGS